MFCFLVGCDLQDGCSKSVLDLESAGLFIGRNEIREITRLGKRGRIYGGNGQHKGIFKVRDYKRD